MHPSSRGTVHVDSRWQWKSQAKPYISETDPESTFIDFSVNIWVTPGVGVIWGIYVHIRDTPDVTRPFRSSRWVETCKWIKISKIYSQHIHHCKKWRWPRTKRWQRNWENTNTWCEFAKAGSTQRFKTKTGMKIHSCTCNFNYGLTEQKWEVERIIDVFGR